MTGVIVTRVFEEHVMKYAGKFVLWARAYDI